MKFFQNKNYQYFMNKVKECEDFCLACTIKGDEKLATFYRNAAEGYRIKAQNLKLQEA